MAGLKEVRERIKSVISTQQITKAMKMVSASKLRKAQTSITQMRPYADRLSRMLSNILSNLDGDANTSFGKARDIKKVLVVVVTSNRGLCGGFNTNISKEAMLHITSKYPHLRKSKDVDLMFIGKKGYDFLRRRLPELPFSVEHVALFERLDYTYTSEVAKQLMQMFSDGKYDAIDVVYSQFKNAVTQLPTVQQWLPVPKMENSKGSAKKSDYIFLPNKQDLLEELVPSILQLNFHKFLLDTHAGEHGARMSAMDNATENAEDLLRQLRINYNKARQESITKELLEIVSGAAALEG